MARKVSKPKSAEMVEDNSVEEQTSGGDRQQLLYPVLLSCELTRDVTDEEDEKEPTRFYDATIKPASITDGLNVGLCSFSAGEKVGDFETLRLEASYYVAFRAGGTQPTDSAFRELMAQVASISAWQLFRTLFSQVVSQANQELPALPEEPDFTWLKMDQETPE
jgi:hypothetical protein